MPIGMTPCFRKATWRRGIVPFWNFMGQICCQNEINCASLQKTYNKNDLKRKGTKNNEKTDLYFLCVHGCGCECPDVD